MGSIRDSLLKDIKSDNKSSSNAGKAQAKKGSVRAALLEYCSEENHAKRQNAVLTWVNKYNAAIQNPNKLDVRQIEKLILQYDGIKDYASAYGLTGAPQMGRQLQELRKTAEQQERRKLETDILHPEKRVQEDEAGIGKSAALPSLSVAEQLGKDHIKQTQTEAARQQKYGGKSYGQIKEILTGMEDGEEKTWLEQYAPTIMTTEDYDSEIAKLEDEIYNLQTYYLERYDNAIKNLGGLSPITGMIIDEINEKFGSRTELAEYIDSLKEKKLSYENNRKYNFLSENEDFAEQSKVAATEGSANFFDGLANNSRWHYDMINELFANNLTADAVENENHLFAGMIGAIEGNYAYMTENEKAIYNYVYNTQGADSAEGYLKYLDITLDGRSKQYTQQEWKKLATALPVQTSIASVPMTLWSGAGYLDAAGQKLINDIKENVTGEYAGPVNYNRAAMMPSVVSSTIRGTVSQNLAQRYGTIEFDKEDHPILSKIFNGKSWGDVYQLGMSMVDSTAVALMSPVIGTAGTLMLSGSAATQTMLNAVENGATDEQALTMGALSGAFEYLFEKYELENLLKNGSENVVRAFVAQSLSEGFGEGATTIANTLADTIVMADKSEVNRIAAEYMKADPKLTEAEAMKKAWMDIAIQIGWDVVGGVASGSIMGGSYAGINKGMSKLQQLAQDKVNAEQDALQKLAVEKIRAEQQGQTVNTADVSIKEQLRNNQDALNEMQPAADIQTPKSFSQLDIAGKINWVIEKLRPTGYQVERKGMGTIKFGSKQLKGAFKYFTKGSVEEAAFEAIPYVLENGIQIAEHVDHKDRSYGTVTIAAPVTIDGVRGNMAVVVKKTTENFYKVHRILTPEGAVFELSATENEAEPTSAGESPETGSLATPISSASTGSISQTMPSVNGEISSAEGQVVRNSDDATVQIADVESAGNGKLTVKLTDGSTADISELSFPNMGEQELWRVLAEYSEDAEHARQLLKEYRAGNLGAFEYAKGVEEAFLYGKLNIDGREMSRRGSFVNRLNPMQKNMAYKYGQFAGEKQTKQREAEASERNAKRERKGGVYYGYEGEKLDKSKLNKAQRVGVNFAERLARRKGITTYFYRSYDNEQGERVYKDREGNIVPANENGWYDPSDGSIHIDLNCGDMGSTVLFTIAHELTHFIQDWSADRYRTLCKILTEGYLEMGQSVDELVRNKQEEYRKRKIELSYEEAFDEVIASSMEGVLSDGRVMDLLDDVETKDMSLADQIRSFLEDTAALIRDTIQAYRDVKPESPEGKIVQRMQGIHDQLQEVFAAGLHEGGENYRQGGKINTAQAGGVKMQLRNVNGANVVWIENSSFTNSQLRDSNAIASYIASHIGDVYRIIESGQCVYIGPDLPGEYTHSKYTSHLQKKSKATLKAKNKATPGIGEMIEIATNRRWEKTRHNHSKDAQYGMYRYDTQFAFPIKDRSGNTISVKAYSAELLIRNASDGKKYLYDIVNIKEDTAKAIDLQNREARKGSYAAASRSSVSQKQYTQSGAKSQQNSATNSPKSIRYEKNEAAEAHLQRENAAMGEDVAGLNELVAAMRRQGKDGSLETSTLDAAAATLMKKVNAKGKKAELMQLLDRFYQYVGRGQELTWEDIRKAARPAVNWLIDHIALDERMSELEFAYNRELMEQELLYRIYGSYWNASTLYIVAGQHEAQIRQLKGKHNQRMNQVYQRHRDMEERQKQTYRQRQEAARHHYEEQHQKREAEYRESRRKAVERHDVAQIRQQIKKDVQRLDSLLNKGTKKRNVKLGLQEFVGAALRLAKGTFLNDYNEYDMIRNGLQNSLLPEEQAAFNRCRELLEELDELPKEPGADNLHDKWDPEQAMRRDDREEALKRELYQNMRILRDGNVFQRERAGAEDATAEQLADELLAAYQKLAETEFEHLQGLYSVKVYDQIEKTKNFLKGKAIKDMTAVELKELSKLYRMISETVSRADELFGAHRNEKTSKRGNRMRDQLATDRDADMHAFVAKLKEFGWSLLTPEAAAAVIGSDELTQAIREVEATETVQQQDLEHARQYAAEQAQKFNRKNWDTSKQVKFAGTEITIGQAMALFAYTERKAGRDHISGDGFEASVGVQREILEAVLGIRIGDDVIGNAIARYSRRQAVIQGGAL